MVVEKNDVYRNVFLTTTIIQTIALAIQKKIRVRELEMMQIATHPLLTSAPTVHPLVNVAHQAMAKLRAGMK